jgi:4'-phosphopantetheinyl transferase
MPDSTPRLAAGDVRAWFATTDVLSDPARVARALAWLNETERARFSRFRHDIDRHMFLLGRVLARSIVSRLTGWPPASWPWREGPHGRPEIAADHTDLRFNIAHSAGLVICVAGHGREIGVDVEDLERPATDLEIVPRYCAPAEVADIEASGEGGWRTRFLYYWTLKEAYLKARGLGISVPLAEIEFTIADPPRIRFLGSLSGTDTRWAFHLRRVTPRHLVAVAAASADTSPAVGIEPFPEAWLP